MIVRVLSAPVGPALSAAAADLAAAPPGTAEEWRLPDQSHALAAALVLDVSGRSLTLRGGDACVLAFAAGGLTVRADDVTVIELGVAAAAATGAGLSLEAGRIRIQDVDVAATAAGDLIALDLDGGTAGHVDAEDVRITRGQAGGAAVGLRARGERVRITGAEISGIGGGAVTALLIGAIDDAEVVAIDVTDVTATALAVGVLVGGGDRVQVARVRVSDVGGDRVHGVVVLGSGTGDGSVSAIDLGAERLTGITRATGLVVAAPRRVTLRGFTATNVAAAAATAVVVVGGRAGGDAVRDPETGQVPVDVEVGFGHVERIIGSAGDAAGVRVIAAPSPRPLIVRDVAVSEVIGAPVPGDAEPVRDGAGDAAWQGWGDGLLADLADDGVPRVVPPALFAAADVVGLAVTAIADEIQPFLDDLVAGDLAVVDCSVRVVSGSALQLETSLRPSWLRRVEVATALRGGWIGSDQLVIANTTWDRLGAPLRIGPGEVRIYDSIFSRIAGPGAPVVLDADADWGEVAASFWGDGASGGDDRFADLGALPYQTPGNDGLPAALAGGTLPPHEVIDLRPRPEVTLHRAAVRPPPDDLAVDDDPRLFVGAHAPHAAVGCALYDPLRAPDTGAPPVPLPNPVVDYRARDARGLLAVMMGRAAQVMRPWSDRGPADLTTMLLETVAERLDHLAYGQERATAEGFLEDARLRRSVEDHVRPLDYAVDPGLSAVTLLAFRRRVPGPAEPDLAFDPLAALVAERRVEADATTDAARKAALDAIVAALDEIVEDGGFEIPAGTLAANARNDDQVIVFATEEPLTYFTGLDAAALVDDLAAGATRARLEGRFPGLAVGRWLVIQQGGTRNGHIVRVTTVSRGTDVLEVGWDPRRPLPWPVSARGDDGAPAGAVLGNVVPAHHGVPLSALPDEAAASADMARYRALLDLVVRGGPGTEVVLPFAPVAIQAPGYPLPGDEGRRGLPRVRVLVDDDEWTRVDDLAGADAGAEVFALRSSADGRASLRFGDGESSGAALPSRQVRLRLDLTIGLGKTGNVGPGVVNRLLHIPLDRARGPISGWLFREDMETLRGLIAVTNPLPGVGGRDAEPIERIRYQAPLLASRPVSAVTADDYERVARSLREVAGAHARVVAAAVRPVVRVTVLLRDEDTLDDSERLRRWAAVRAALEDARLLGFDVESVPPVWTPLDLDVEVDAHPHAEAGAVRDAVLGAVAGDGGLLDPDVSGLGGDVQLADLYRAVRRAPGVAAARVRRFRRLAPFAAECLGEGVIPMAADEVAVVRGPSRPDADGVLTVTVCGGLR